MQHSKCPMDLTGATALGALANADPGVGMASITNSVASGGINIQWFDAFIGTHPWAQWGKHLPSPVLIGAIILIATGIGSWRIMAAVVIGAVGLSSLLHGMYLAGITQTSVFAMSPILASRYWGLRLRNRLHGNRPRLRSNDKRRKMDLRNINWCDDSPHSRHQPCIPRRHHARNSVRKRFRTRDRILRHPS